MARSYAACCIDVGPSNTVFLAIALTIDMLISSVGRTKDPLSRMAIDCSRVKVINNRIGELSLSL